MVCDKHQPLTHITSCKADFGQYVGLTIKTTFVYLLDLLAGSVTPNVSVSSDAV